MWGPAGGARIDLMPTDPRAGRTAFVLAGGGTKGSFEVGVLQYLVGVEGIVPDIITATSAGAIAATVLAQARTLAEFAQRVDEIEDDVLAWTNAGHVFGKQAWLAALDGTALGREIHQEITEGTRPPFPLTPATVLAGGDVVPPAARVQPAAATPGAARPAAGANATSCASAPAPSSACPGSAGSCARAAARSSTSTPWRTRCATAASEGMRPVDPALVARPGLQLRLAVTALRAGVLRYVTEDGTIVESDARTPAPGTSAGPVDLVDGAIASASVPMVFPPHPMADDDYVDGGVIEIVPVRAAAALGATRIIAVVAVPLRLAARRARLRGGARRLHRPAVHGHDRGGRAADLQPQRRPPGGFHAHDHRPRRRRGRPLRDRARPPAHQQGLRLAARRRRPGRRATPTSGPTSPTAPTPSSRPAARPGAWRSRSGPNSPTDGTDAGTLALVREQKERVRDLVDRRKQLGFPVPDGCERWWTDYEAHTAERPAAACRRSPGADGPSRLTAQTVGPPSQPRRRNKAKRNTTVASSSPMPSTKKVHVGASHTRTM